MCRPRSFFPERLQGKRLLTVPACEPHNNSNAGDIEYVRGVLCIQYNTNATAEEGRRPRFEVLDVRVLRGHLTVSGPRERSRFAKGALLSLRQVVEHATKNTDGSRRQQRWHRFMTSRRSRADATATALVVLAVPDCGLNHVVMRGTAFAFTATEAKAPCAQRKGDNR
jgi:hypothetical protein